MWKRHCSWLVVTASSAVSPTDAFPGWHSKSSTGVTSHPQLTDLLLEDDNGRYFIGNNDAWVRRPRKGDSRHRGYRMILASFQILYICWFFIMDSTIFAPCLVSLWRCPYELCEPGRLDNDTGHFIIRRPEPISTCSTKFSLFLGVSLASQYSFAIFAVDALPLWPGQHQVPPNHTDRWSVRHRLLRHL